ncbi:MAG: hypothetical protein JWO40_24 [Candidatus Doudnabacteria bacterium]|nr:hypothetical protein [Candidatus Doudnabacteria bacterium]
MKRIANILMVLLVVFFVLRLGTQQVDAAATTPSLGAAATYGVLTGTYANTSATTINGDVGFTVAPAIAPSGTHTNYGSSDPYTAAGADQGTALSALNAETCTFIFGAATDLATLSQPIIPGVYCITGAVSITTGITLSGSGTYTFRIVGALNSTAGITIALAGGASACDIFWTPTGAVTLGAGTTFIGTVIDPAAVTLGAGTIWTGRALAFGKAVTSDTNSITVPSCSAPAPPPPPAPSPSPTPTPTPSPSPTPTPPPSASINVVATVINDNGRTKVVADFPLFVNGSSVISGQTNSFAAPASYTVTETADVNYTQEFSGDCDASGRIDVVSGSQMFCIVINDDIAPLIVPPSSGGGGSGGQSPPVVPFIPVVVPTPPVIDIIKIPNPLALPGGPGLVTFTYTLRNIGTVPVTNITILGNSCKPINLTSGDINSDDVLDINEIWIYRCSVRLTKTNIDVAVATGWANNISATDIASATVVVGMPAIVITPIIHVINVPNSFTLPVRGGMITYVQKISNPGKIALSNVNITDDKCSPVEYVTGDKNSDSRLGITETWDYTCTTRILKTTTNTAIATGQANGILVKDLAIATVIVASPAPTILQKDNIDIKERCVLRIFLLLIGLLLLASFLWVVPRRKKRKKQAKK